MSLAIVDIDVSFMIKSKDPESSLQAVNVAHPIISKAGF